VSQVTVSAVKRLLSGIKDGTHGSFQRVDDGRPLLSAKNVLDGLLEVSSNESQVSESDYQSIISNGYPRHGDVLLTIVGSIGRSCVFEQHEPIAFQRSVAFLRPRPTVNSRYLSYLLQSSDVQEQLRLATKLAAQGGVYMGDVCEARCTYVAEERQERIANFLDDKTARIDTLIAEKMELLERLPEYLYSYASTLMTKGTDARAPLQQTSFPELGSIPSHWDVKRLKFLGEVRSGVAKGKDIGEKATVSLPYLRVANVQDGYVDLTDVHNIEVAESEAQRYLLRVGDVLMNEGGDNDKLGRGTVWQGQIDPCIHQNHVFAVRVHDLELAEWLARFTSTDAARSYFFLRSKQSTNLASINQSNVRELPVPMPPAAERKAILDLVRSSAARVQALVRHAEEHIERLREYRSSLISAAVTGQLDCRAETARKVA
jgi:type I restriction enzyme S subunit